MLKKLASTGLAAGLALGVGAAGNVSFASELDDTQVDLSTQSNTELQDGQVDADDNGAGLNIDLDVELDDILGGSESDDHENEDTESDDSLLGDDLLGGIL